MSVLKGNAVVGQSGGPTAAINATLSGVIRGALDARKDGVINTLYGMKNGIEGFLREDLVDLFGTFDTEEKLRVLESTPAAVLGSCRRRLKEHEEDADTYERILELLRKHNIRYFFYIGGNDSMDTVLKLSRYAASHDYEIRVVGVPKTIDNDLMVTDHTPGFGSAAKFVATTIKEIRRDISVYSVKAVTIVEIMGRDAGWLTAAAAIPTVTGDAPDLIYLPECPFDKERFISDVKAAMERRPYVLVAVSEGIRFPDGEYVGASNSVIDAFGHKALSGAGKALEGIIKHELGCKVRSIELNLPQRCAAHIASLCDIREALDIGAAAVLHAMGGATAVMVTIERQNSDTYATTIGVANIADIANGVKHVPREFINEAANGITKAGIDYLLPLIEGEVSPIYEHGMPKHAVID